MLTLMLQTRKGWSVLVMAGVLVMLAAQWTTADSQAHNGSHGEHAKADHVSKKSAKLHSLPYILATDPVSGKLLPPHDKQIIVQYEGRELRFASHDTHKKFMADPDKYLKNIDRQLIGLQMPYYPLSNCMISGEKLGGEMGEPVDYLYKNRLIRFCCQGCKKDFLKENNRGRYLTQLDEAVIAKQKPVYPLKTCVVSGEELASMDEPIDHVVGNRLIRFCCQQCVKHFNKEPAKYMQMLDQSVKSHGKQHAH